MSDDVIIRALRDAAAVEPRGAGRYAVTLSPYFSVVGRPNGGYLQCVMANAALAAAAAEGATHQHTTAITTNYIGAPQSSTVAIETQVRKVGRGASFVYAALREDGVITTESLVTLGTLSEDSRLRYHDASPFDIAPLEECAPARSFADDINISHSMETRYDPSSIGWWTGERSDRAEIKAWMRLDDSSADWWDPWTVLFASDGLPPATFPIGSTGWVPTLQLSSYVRSIPTSEWLRVRQWCVVVEDGLADERCEIFDDRDRLVASASQLMMCRFPQGE